MSSALFALASALAVVMGPPTKAKPFENRAPVKRAAKPTLKNNAALLHANKGEKKARFNIAVQFVRTADDDGGRASALTEKQAKAALERTNEIWARNGGDIKFWLHPASNFDSIIEDTRLNRDCILAPGMDEAKIAAKTNPDLDGDDKGATDADRDILCNYTSTGIARTGYAAQRADRLIVYSRGGNDSVKWNSSAGHWVLGHPSGGASSAKGLYVRMPYTFGGSTLLAHEIGHYMHSPHTFKNAPASVAKARTAMETWAKDHPGDDPRNAFDGDRKVSVYDTPPDPRSGLLESVHGEGTRCDKDKGSVSIPVTVGTKTTVQVLAPDRALVMSYFKGCKGFDHYLSRDQLDRAREALAHGNRSPLVGGHNRCYSSGWKPGPLPTTEEKLAQLIRTIAKCTILYKEPMPWEILAGGDIYINPATKRKGFILRGGVRVNPAREHALIKSMVEAKMVE